MPANPTRVTSQDILDLTIVDGDVAAANKDGSAATPSMRTLGTGSSQAAAGDHSHADADNFVSGVAVDSEVPTGAIDGVNADFVLAFTPIATSEHVYKNGLRQFVGASNDYTIVTDTITFVAGNLPQTGDRVIVDYRK